MTCQLDSRTSADVIDCSGYAKRHGKLKLKGIQLVDEFDEPVQLQGISSFGLQYYPHCVTKEAISYLVRNWGITVFRAVVSLSDTGYTSNPSFFDDFVNDIVDWCEELGIYVIIDWHVLDPGDPNFYLTSRGAHTGIAIDFWKQMAVLYKSRTHVLYEIANEPNGVSWNTTLEYHNSVIYEIRKIDTDTVIIAGTNHFSQDLDLAYVSPVKYPHNVMYAFHFYSTSHGYLFPMFQQYSLLIPVFVSEFGLNDYTCTSELNEDVTNQYMTVFRGSNTTPVISWAVWSWSDKDETCSALLAGSCTSRAWDSLSCTGLYMANYMKESNLNGSFGCFHSTTTYPTSLPTSIPSLTPGPRTKSNEQIITKFVAIYGSLALGLVLIGALLYYLQIVYYPRRPQDKAHIPGEREMIPQLTKWRNTTRYQAPHSLDIPPSLEEEQDKEEAEVVLTNSDGHSRHASQFLVTNPLKMINAD